MATGMGAAEIAQLPLLELDVRNVEKLMKRISKNGSHVPELHGCHGNQKTTVQPWHILSLRLRLLSEEFGARATMKRMCDWLYIDCKTGG